MINKSFDIENQDEVLFISCEDESVSTITFSTITSSIKKYMKT